MIIIAMLALAAIALPACSDKTKETSPLEGFPEADMSEYEALAGYTGSNPFVYVTVQDVHKLIEEKATFALFVSFPNCPWCNAVIREFVEVANEVGAGIKVANINTRQKPEWTSNLDIDDYDLFVQHFGDYLNLDDAGIKHLYVPHVFFIKDGDVVYEHQGAIPEMGSDPYMVLNEEQEEILKDVFREGFDSILK